jgi:hypothetical protein
VKEIILSFDEADIKLVFLMIIVMISCVGLHNVNRKNTHECNELEISTSIEMIFVSS